MNSELRIEFSDYIRQDPLLMIACDIGRLSLVILELGLISYHHPARPYCPSPEAPDWICLFHGFPSFQ